MSAPLGLVAGSGGLPEELARRARAAGRRVVCVQLAGEPERLAGLCDRHRAAPLARALEALRLFHEEGVKDLVLAGKVDKLAAGPAVRRLLQGDGRDPELWKAVRALLEDQGFRVLAVADLAPDLVAREGLLAGRPPDAREQEDLVLGFRVASQLAAAGVGQAVAVRHGVVLAVEAAEGTDEMVRRCGSFGPGAVVVKVSWPQADARFDPPVAGPGTLEAMRQAGATALGVQAGAGLVLDLPTVRSLAEEWGLSVVGISG